MNINDFINYLKELNINPTKDQLDKLDKYYKLLVETNKITNLTRIIEEKEVYLKHFYDSLTITKCIDLNKVDTLCDIGTGAGFPGIVLKIFYDNLDITLIESNNKKVSFLNKVIKELNLNNIKVLNIRAEEDNNTYDVITARAVANLNKLLTYSYHLLNNNSKLIAMKANIDHELEDFNKSKFKNKVIIEDIIKFKLPIEDSNRSLVVISKDK